MREIKFRGLRVDGKGWVYGALFTDNQKTMIRWMHNPLTNDYTDIEVKPESVGQFTGLKDKNGTDIYEGDVMYCSDMYYKLVKHEGGNYELHEVGTDKVYHLFMELKHIEIIGNIHEGKYKQQ